jgi:hypothetical protein
MRWMLLISSQSSSNEYKDHPTEPPPDGSQRNSKLLCLRVTKIPLDSEIRTKEQTRDKKLSVKHIASQQLLCGQMVLICGTSS